MQAYGYDKDGYFVGVLTAQPNPMASAKGEPEFLLPGHTTSIAPPAVPENKAAKWVITGPYHDDGRWEIVDSPEYLAAQKEAFLERLVIFYRKKGEPAVVGGQKLKEVFHEEHGVLFEGKTLSSTDVAALICDETPSGWDSKTVGGVYTKKIVDGEILDRDPEEIFREDPVAQSRRCAVIYRNAQGKDKKVVSVKRWQEYLGNAPTLHGVPITSLPTLAYAELDLSYEQISEIASLDGDGITRYKLNHTLDGYELRAKEDKAKDRSNAKVLRDHGEELISQLTSELTGLPYTTPLTTHIMNTQHALMVAMNVDGSSSAQEITQAKDTLSVYKAIYTQARSIRASVEDSIALLDETDY